MARHLSQTRDQLRVEGRRACRIRTTFKTGGYRDPDIWHKTQDAMVEAIIKLEQALNLRIAELKSWTV
jgi:hypothetical protein